MTRLGCRIDRIPVRKLFGWISLGKSALLLTVVWIAFIQQYDRLALLTVLPIWLWSAAGILLSVCAWWGIRRHRLAFCTLAWLGITVIFADETKVLWNGHHPSPQPGPPPMYEDQPVIRVISMNCATFEYGNPMEDLARWQPDIILLQDAYPHQVQWVTQRIFGQTGHHAGSLGHNTGIISRWPIIRQINTKGTRCLQATIRIPGSIDVEVVNLHLSSANTDLRIWKRSTWTQHRINRSHRLAEIHAIQRLLRHSTAFPMTPVLLGGDFNAPATDVVHRHITDHLQDSFLQSGSGLGNTYHRRCPILRIDYLYHSFHFRAVRSRAVESVHSDHRMIVADYLISR